MINVKISCPELFEECNFKLHSSFDFNILREVLIRFERTALVDEDYFSMFCPGRLSDPCFGGKK